MSLAVVDLTRLPKVVCIESQDNGYMVALLHRSSETGRSVWLMVGLGSLLCLPNSASALELFPKWVSALWYRAVRSLRICSCPLLILFTFGGPQFWDKFVRGWTNLNVRTSLNPVWKSMLSLRIFKMFQVQCQKPSCTWIKLPTQQCWICPRFWQICPRYGWN